MANCLVTGHKGFIGSRLYTKLQELGHEVYGIDTKSEELSENLDIRWHLFDHEKNCYHVKFKPEYVFHLAAKPSVQWSVENPSESLAHNVMGSSRVLEYSKLVGAKRLIFASSAAAANPTSPYGAHKRMTEIECQVYASLYDIDTLSLRFYNVYSEDQPYGGAYSTAISAWFEMIRTNNPLRIDGDGTQTRDFIHVDDIVDCLIHCMDRSDKFSGRVLEVGTGVSHSLQDIKKFIDNVYDVTWVHSPERAGDIKYSVADIAGLLDIGWQPKITLKKGLQRCVAHATK